MGAPITRTFLDIILEPVAQPRILGLPLGKSSHDVAAHLGGIAPVVKPAQFPQAIAVTPDCLDRSP